MKINITKYIKTVQMSAQSTTNGGILYLLPNYLMKVFYVVPMLLLWKTLMESGVETGMTLSQMLTYTYLGAIFSDLLVVITPASGWLYEGLFVSLYQRPLRIFSHLASQTVGKWIPNLLFFTLPMIIAAPLFSVSLRTGSLWFFPSLILCISLGFAVDFLFACMTIRMMNASWLVYVIRMAIVSFLSGSVIPFKILPWGLEQVFQYLPFGSLAAAPLAIYTGLSEPIPLLVTQIFWNIVLWPVAFIVFDKSQEGMMSFGG